MSFTYRGLKATLDRHMVTPEEIEHNLQRLQQQNFRIAEILDRPTENGDEVVLDYAGYCDGVQFPGGTAEKQTLTLGSGMFIPGFEEQLLDKVPGEKVTVKVTFPEQYHAAELAGKEAQFHCTIHAIRVKTPYELDDTFAKEVGNCDTMDQMREKMGQSLQAYVDERGEMDLQDRLLRQAAESLNFTPSEAQMEAELDNLQQNMEAQLARQGLTLDAYFQFMNTTKEQFREDSRAEAAQSIRMKAAIEQIVDLEGLTVTKEDLAEAYTLICRQNGMTLEQLKPHIDAQFEQAVTESVLRTKAMLLVREAAEVTEA